jgi:hypothetical protein
MGCFALEVSNSGVYAGSQVDPTTAIDHRRRDSAVTGDRIDRVLMMA